MSVRSLDHLPERADEHIGRDRGAWRGIGAGAATDIVDAFKDQQPLHPRRTKHVAVEARQSAYAGTISQNGLPDIP